MRCPGQDPRSWTIDAASDIPCPRCAHPVELFKDERAGRCRRCGHRFSNPKVAFDCANWCEFAEQCTGVRSPATTSLAETALANRLLRAVEARLQRDASVWARSLLIFQHAAELLARSGGDARVVLAAALLLPLVGDDGPRREPGEDEVRSGRQSPESEDLAALLRSVGLDEAAVEHVGRLREAAGRRAVLDDPAFRILNDAELLARRAAEWAASGAARGGEAVAEGFLTEAGRQRARELFAREA
jgi:hypothetical protein